MNKYGFERLIHNYTSPTTITLNYNYYREKNSSDKILTYEKQNYLINIYLYKIEEDLIYVNIIKLFQKKKKKH